MKMPFRSAGALVAIVAAMLSVLGAQSPPEPKPAFAGQTDAPAPAKPSPPIAVQTVAGGLTGAWAFAILPNGALLVTQNSGTMRIVRPDNGSVSAPLAGVPPVKSAAAQGFHDVVLDPDFAQNRYVYFTYFAPPKGEARRHWPIEHFYNDVWNKPLAERRVLDLGTESVARARLSADNRRLEDVDVLIEGVERRIVFARDGTMYVTGADAFRFYDSDLDSIEPRLHGQPRRPPQLHGPRDSHQLATARSRKTTRGSAARPCCARRSRTASRIPKARRCNPPTGELWLVDHGPQGGDEINIVRAGHDYGWPEVSYGVQYDARQPDGRKNVPVGSGQDSEGRRRRADLLLGAVDRAVGHDVLHRRPVPRLEGQPLRRRDGRPARASPRAARLERRARRGRGEAVGGSQGTNPLHAAGTGWIDLRDRRSRDLAAHAEEITEVRPRVRGAGRDLSLREPS